MLLETRTETGALGLTGAGPILLGTDFPKRGGRVAAQSRRRKKRFISAPPRVRCSPGVQSGGGNALQQFAREGEGIFLFQLGPVVEDDPVVEDGGSHAPHVLEAHGRAAVHQCRRPGGFRHGDGRPGRRSEGGALRHLLHLFRRPRVGRRRQAGDIRGHGAAQVDLRHDLEALRQFRGLQKEAHLLGFAPAASGDDLGQSLRIHLGHVEFEHEAVQLGLGQGVGPLHVDGILGGEDEEGLGQGPGLPGAGHLPLLHGFEHGGLSLGRGPVDLVREQDVGENGPRLELQTPGTVGGGLQNGPSGDVPGEQVGGELDPVELQLQHLAQSPDQRGLAHAGEPFQQDVAPAQDPGHDQKMQFVLTEEQPVQLGHGGGGLLLDFAEFFFADKCGNHGRLSPVSKYLFTAFLWAG